MYNKIYCCTTETHWAERKLCCPAAAIASSSICLLKTSLPMDWKSSLYYYILRFCKVEPKKVPTFLKIVWKFQPNSKLSWTYIPIQICCHSQITFYDVVDIILKLTEHCLRLLLTIVEPNNSRGYEKSGHNVQFNSHHDGWWHCQNFKAILSRIYVIKPWHSPNCT